MNNTIILNQLSETIAKLTGVTADDAELFVRELSALIAERLETDGQVEVPGLGTFVVSDETVVYAPDSTLAEEINAPFAAFEAIELPDDESDQSDLSDMSDPSDRSAPQPEAEQEIAAAAEFEQEALAEEPAAPAESDPSDRSAPSDMSDQYDPQPVEEPKRSLTWPWWLIGCIVCFIGGYICGNSRIADEPPAEPEPELEIVEVVEVVDEPEPALVEDTVIVVAPRPVVTDTIASGYFLTSMARKHYGHMDFWPYIYEANASKLDRPDRLARGTVVVIPSADSLNLDPQNADQLGLARQMATAIYARFNAK